MAADRAQFRPELILPVQFHSASLESSERRLMLAVLKDALDILTDRAEHSDRGHARLVAEAEQWVLSEDWAWPFSFLNLCHALGIDPQWIRRRLGTPRVETPPDAAPAPPVTAVAS